MRLPRRCATVKALVIFVMASPSISAAHAADTATSAPDPGRKTVVQGKAARREVTTHAETINVSAAHVFEYTHAQKLADSTTRISSETLTKRRVVSVTDLQALAPNLTAETLKGTQSINYHLRGIGFDDYYENNMSSVMVYVDGVAYPFSSMTDGMMFDLAGVDIVPGPVGSYHGMADSGGEINLHTADPTSTWHGGLTEDIASYARSRTTAYVSGPLSRTVAFRIAAETSHGGGWQYNPVNGAHLGDQNRVALRGKVRWTPDSKTTVTVGGHWTQDKSQLVNGQVVANLDPSWQTTPHYTSYRQTEWGIRPELAALVGRPADLKPSENNQFWGANIDFIRDLGFAKLETLSAFEVERQQEYADEDALMIATADNYRNVDANVFSQEVKLSSQRGPLEWGTGMYYLRSRMHQQFVADFSDYVGRGYISDNFYDQNQQTFSQYANISYRLPLHLRLFGGLNHTSDDRQILNYHTINIGQSYNAFGPHGALTNQLGGVVGIDAQVDKDLLLYFKISKGFKPGGFAANTIARPEQLNPFGPESVLAYELGFKSDPVPGKIRLNGAAFYYDYHNQQIVSSLLIPDYGPVGMYVNIPKSEVWGIEMSSELHPVRHLYVTGNFGYERGTFQKFNALNSGATNAYHATTNVWKAIYQSWDGEDSGIPKLSLSGTAAYRINPTANYEMELGLNWSYRDSQAMTVGGNGIYRIPPYFLMGTYLDFHPKNEKWDVSVYVTNLLNRQYSSTTSSGTSTYQHIPGEPRFIGARFGFNL
ncbi:MAG: TonB-dependent receptor [Gluconacetobacter sp.]